MELKTDKYWVTGFNFMDEVRQQFDLPERVQIYDVTLREGDQTPGCVFRADEKIELAKDLDELGVDVIEMFAMVSEDDRMALKTLSAPGVLKHAKLASLARTVPIDIETAANCGVKKIALEGPANLFTAKQVLGLNSEDELIKLFRDSVKLAKSLGMEVLVGGWDCGRSTMAYLERFVKEMAEAGVSDIAYADTFGYTTPFTTQYMIRKYREWAGPEVVISAHFHNDYGLATANSLAAITAGASSIHTAMNGLGERVGNTCLDELALNLALTLDVKTDIKLEKLYPLSKKIEEISKIPIARNKPVVGSNAFLMGSGLVVDMIRKNEKENMICASFPYTTDLIGAPSYTVAYGKGVGNNMIQYLLNDMGLTATKDQIKGITNAIKTESLLIKSTLPEYRVKSIILECLK